MGEVKQRKRKRKRKEKRKRNLLTFFQMCSRAPDSKDSKWDKLRIEEKMCEIGAY